VIKNQSGPIISFSYRMEQHMNYLRGSEWRKWDLHFHTPSSNCYNNKAITDEEIINGLIKAGIAAVAITDHHKIDVERIKELQRLAADKLTIFPGIEFRSELGGSNSVHFIGIFSEDCDIDDIWQKLKVKCQLTDKEIAKQGGPDEIFFSFENTASLIRGYGGLVSIHAGTKCNGIEKELPSVEKVCQAIKRTLLGNCVDFLDIGNAEKDITRYRDIIFPKIGKELPIIICSDNHDINKYQTKTPCWVKADPTFKGLRQLFIEPIERVFIGEEPPKHQHIANNRPKEALIYSLSVPWYNFHITP